MKVKIDIKKNKKQLIFLGICIILLLINACLGLVSKFLIHRMPDQLTADRWEVDTNMAQVSVFVTEEQVVSEGDIPKMKYNLEKKLEEAGVLPVDADDEAGAGKSIVDTVGIDEMNADDDSDDSSEVQIIPETEIKKLYRFVYSAQGLATLTCDDRTVENVNAIGVGGDFFIFHPLELASGSYLMDNPLMKDGIVIDEDIAWHLFGSSDVIGMQVMIGDTPHYIKGVVKKPRGKIEKMAGLDKSYVFMSYDSLSKYGEILSAKTTSGEEAEEGPSAVAGGINCIEVVCPNPVKGLAKQMTFESTGLGEDNTEVVDNTDRFSFLSLIDVLKSFGTRSMWRKAIYYPYWENIAKGYEDRLAIILAIRIFLVSVAVIIAVGMIIHAYRHKKWTIESVVLYLADKKYDLEVKHNEKKNKASNK